MKTSKFWIRSSSFQWGVFIFLAAEKTTFLEAGYNFKTGQPVTILGHIQACPNRFLAQKTCAILRKGGQGQVMIAPWGGKLDPCMFNRKYWSEPRKHDKKRHRAAAANKLVPILATRRASKDGCRFRCILCALRCRPGQSR